MIRRRQIVQFIVASTVAAACGGLARKTLAQDVVPSPSEGVSLLLYGVSAVSDRAILQSLDLTALNTQDLSAGIPEIALQPNERLSGFTMLLDGTFVIATAPVVASIVGQPHPSRLILISFAYPQILPTLQELEPNNVIESLLATNDGELLSIISLNQGTPPFRLAKINRQTGEVSFIDELPLPANQRFSNLAQSPDGLIYATSLNQEGSTMLVQLDLVQGSLTSLSKLTFNNRFLRNDLASLAFSSSGALFALGDPTYTKANSVFRVEKSTGEMELVTNFSSDKIVFARS